MKKKIKIGLVTYDRPHFKTYQVLKKLLKKKYEVVLLIIKFKNIKKNFNSSHRPNQFGKKFNFNKFKIEKRNYFDKKDISDLKYVLIGGAGIIEKKKIISNKIINCHSGLIPESRGLDSVKWSIFNGNLVGNTLHFIDDNIDSGNIIHQEITQLNPKNNLKQFYKTHYDKEINILVEFEKYIKKGQNFKLKGKLPTLRFPKIKYAELNQKFKIYKNNFSKLKKKYQTIYNQKGNFYIHDTSLIDKNVKIGEGTKIWHWCHISKNSKIGKNCVLGQNTYIGENVIIGNNVHIQNNVSVFSGVILKDWVFVGPSVVFTNVKSPNSITKQKYVKTIINKFAVLGANSTVVCGNIIGESSFVGAGSVVTKNVKKKTLVAGVPAKFVKKL